MRNLRAKGEQGTTWSESTTNLSNEVLLAVALDHFITLSPNVESIEALMHPNGYSGLIQV